MLDRGSDIVGHWQSNRTNGTAWYHLTRCMQCMAECNNYIFHACLTLPHVTRKVVQNRGCSSFLRTWAMKQKTLPFSWPVLGSSNNFLGPLVSRTLPISGKPPLIEHSQGPKSILLRIRQYKNPWQSFAFLHCSSDFKSLSQWPFLRFG